ncbi:MAG: pyrroline-5-carboxylate reductase [Bacteroidota bacterium]
MLSEKTLAFIGAGNIGRALIGGLLRRELIPAERIRATRRNPYAVDELREQFPGVHFGVDNAEAVAGADLIVISVKPQNAPAVFNEIQPHVPESAVVVSILAGVTTTSVATALDQDLAVIRAMPNTPALVDEGATAVAPGRFASDADLDDARELFGAVGKVETVPEYLMDAVTGLSGSGPAYVYMVIEALTDGGVKQGLTRSTALRLAAQTVFGAAKLVLETGKHPAILRDEVTTPGGTSIAAVAELESHGLRTMLINAVATATERSQELSRMKRDDR